MEIVATVFPWQKLDKWGDRFDELSRKFLPLVMPWILFPSGISIFAAFVRACVNNSPYELIIFVVFPVTLWVGFSKYAGPKVYGPAFAPSSVAALIMTMAATYALQVSSAVSGVYNLFFGGACLALGASFWRMIMSDPGRITPFATDPDSSQKMHFHGEPGHDGRSSVSSVVIPVDDQAQQEQYCSTCNRMQPLRAKHCKFCNVCIEQFDHHCPAVYNCIGRKNHRLFLKLLVAFIITELLYFNSCVIYLRVRRRVEETSGDKGSQHTGDFYDEVVFMWKGVGEILLGDTWVLSTAAFAGIQALWQVPFFIFHIYCACYNLTTNEMFHWNKYSGVHLEDSLAPPLGRQPVNSHLVKPYAKGMKQNVVSIFGPQT